MPDMCTNTDSCSVVRIRNTNGDRYVVKAHGGYDGYAETTFTDSLKLAAYLAWIWGAMDYDTYQDIDPMHRPKAVDICGCGCEKGPQCNEVQQHTRCMEPEGHEGPHRSYSYLLARGKGMYSYEWSSLSKEDTQ